MPVARLLCALLTLGVLPLMVGLIIADQTFVISAVFPLTVSLIVLVGVIFVEDRLLKQWILGICLAAVSFLIIGIVKTGLGMTSYFGRPRASLGFTHPVITASVIFCAGLFIALILLQANKPNRNTWMKYCAIVLSSILFIGLFWLAQSRNMMVAILLGLLFARVISRHHFVIKFSGFVLILLLPSLLYLYSYFGSSNDLTWIYLDQLSSSRLTFYKEALISYFSQEWIQSLLIPSTYIHQQFSGLVGYRGFAANDSIYLSIMFNYGLFTLVMFLFLLLIVGWRLSIRKELALEFGAFCGVISYFSFAAEGLTTSNLAVFMVFAYTVKRGVNLEALLRKSPQYNPPIPQVSE